MRAGDAALFASDRDARPSGIPDFVFDRRMYEARALATRTHGDIERARQAFRALETRLLGMSPFTMPVAYLVPFYVAIGDFDTASAHLESFYFGRGRYATKTSPGTGPLTQRESDFLFMPTAAPLPSDPRYATLLRTLGISAYWQATGMRADVG